MLDVIFDEIDKDLYDIKWLKHTVGYAQKGSHKGERLAHRIVIARKIGRELRKGELCDHINRNKLDNRRCNLRVADKSINTINRDKRPDNTSGFTGVHLYYPKQWAERAWSKKWKYIIQRKGKKTIYSKLYKSPEEAHVAREKHLQQLNTMG